MSSPPPPFRPEDFDERCETCGAPPGQLCQAWCDTGYTAEDARADAERHTTQSLTSRARPAFCERCAVPCDRPAFVSPPAASRPESRHCRPPPVKR